MISQADQPGTPWKEGSESSLRETHTQGPGGPRHLCSPLATTVLHLPLGLPQTPNHLLVAEGAPDPNQVQLPLPPLGNARVSLCLILLHLVLVGPSRGLSSCPTPYQAAVLPTLPGPAAVVCIPCLPGSTDGQRMDSAVCLHPHGHPQTHSDTPGASAPTGTPQGGRYGVGGVSGGRPGVLRAAWHKGEEAQTTAGAGGRGRQSPRPCHKSFPTGLKPSDVSLPERGRELRPKEVSRECTVQGEGASRRSARRTLGSISRAILQCGRPTEAFRVGRPWGGTGQGPAGRRLWRSPRRASPLACGPQCVPQ